MRLASFWTPAFGGFLLLLPARAWAMPSIVLDAPGAGAVPDSVAVSARVSSPYVVTSVAASIGTAATDLVPAGSSYPGTYAGTLDITPLPLGAATLTITATDANGDTATATRAVTHDRPFPFTVALLPHSVARPGLRLQATCTAGAFSCASVTARVDQTIVASSTKVTGGSVVLDQTASLAPWEAALSFPVHFEARDSAGTVVTRDVPVHVDSSYALVHVDDVGGPILDVDSTRILFAGATGISIKQRAGGAVTVLAPASPPVAFLTPTGAIWNGGEVASGVYAPNGRSDVRVQGDWAAWTVGGAITRYAFGSGVSEAVGSPGATLMDIDATGAVAYVDSDQNLYVDRMGTRTFVTWAPSSATTAVTSARVAGPVLFLIYGTVNLTSQYTSVSLFAPDDAGITGLGVVQGFNVPVLTVAGSWAAFAKSTQMSPSIPEVWTRSPSGVLALACPLPNALPSAINTQGEVAYDVENKRYIGSAGTPNPTKPIFASNAQGTMRFLDGEWHTFIGRELFRIDRSATPPPDAGADGGSREPDGGAPPPGSDAGAPGDPGPSGAFDSGGCAVGSGGDDLSSLLAFAPGLAIAFAAYRRSRRRRDATRPRTAADLR